MASQAGLSKTTSRLLSKRASRDLRNGGGEGSNRAGTIEVTIPAPGPIEPRKRLSRSPKISQSRRLVIGPSGQCSTILDNADGTTVAEEDDKLEVSSVDEESESHIPGTRTQEFKVSAQNKFVELLWWLRRQSKEKHIDAAEDVLATYHDSFLYGKVPLTIKLRAALRGGKWKPLLNWLEFVSAGILVALYVRSTYTSERSAGLLALEYSCSVFFSVDYILKLLSAPVLLYYIFSITGLVDLATSLPIAFVYSNKMGNPFAFFQILLVLRIMRVIPALTSWLVFTSTIGHQIFLLAINTFGAVFIAAGVFQWVEFRATPQSVKDANGCGPNGCMTYYQTLYLMMVTISTVGYGDFTAKSDWGRFVIGITILAAVVILPVPIGKILQLASRRPFGGSFAVRKVIGSRFIIVSGNLSVRMVQDFLSEFYHPSHSGDMLAFPVRVVILAPYKPSFELKTLLLHYQGLVEFIEGTPNKELDLDRVGAEVASAFFLLADQQATDPEAEDAAQIVRTLSVHRYCGPGVRVIVEMLNPEKESSAIWDDVGNEVEIICPEAIRFKLLARSCYIKGIATFVTNLFRSGLTVTKWQSSRHTEWMLQYYHGMRQGIFPVILPPSFSERLVFEKAAELVYARYRVILIGLDVSSAGGRRVLLYPRGRKIRSTDVGLVIAKSLEQAEKVSQFGQRQSFLSCSRKHPKGDDDLLDEISRRQLYSGDELSREYAITFENSEEMVEQVSKLRDIDGGSGSGRSRNEFWKQVATSPRVASTQTNAPTFSSNGPGASSKSLSLEEAVDTAMSWPPLDKTSKPERPVLERRADVIADNLEKNTLRVVSLDEPHVLVCIRGDWPRNLFSFVSHLRISKETSPPIVILHHIVPCAVDWGCVGMFEDVYFVWGSPDYQLDLVRAGVLDAEKVVILTQTSEDQRTVVQEADGDDASIAMTFTSDVQNILVAATVERLQQPNRERLITELQDVNSIQYLRPKFHLKRQRFGQETYQRNRHSAFQFVPPYIEGKGFSPSALAFLMYSTFYNRNTVDIVEHFVSCGVSSEEENEAKVPCLKQIDMPKHYVGLGFNDLFNGLLLRENLLALGLYRPVGTAGSIVPYVYTNPAPDEVMGAEDLVYVLG